jgi:hypothetical protein
MLRQEDPMSPGILSKKKEKKRVEDKEKNSSFRTGVKLSVWALFCVTCK